ncbi:hypothetical protein FS837_012478 [Tulasnella sp. UAMH 9824]|nr:hypothetical protein FS837_012478 [Tulasnella sp. UAMH 9824]
MELDGNGYAKLEELVGDHTIAEGAHPASPPITAGALVVPDHRTTTMLEDGIFAMYRDMDPGMAPSTGHAMIMAQEQDEDEDEIDNQQLETNIKLTANILELDVYASSAGNGTLGAMKTNADELQSLDPPPPGI